MKPNSGSRHSASRSMTPNATLVDPRISTSVSTWLFSVAPIAKATSGPSSCDPPSSMLSSASAVKRLRICERTPAAKSNVIRSTVRIRRHCRANMPRMVRSSRADIEYRAWPSRLESWFTIAPSFVANLCFSAFSIMICLVKSPVFRSK